MIKLGRKIVKLRIPIFYYQSCAVDSGNNRLHQYQGEL